MKLGVVILAAGQGTRMRSATPKVLHPLAGRPLLGHVLETTRSLDPDRVLVVYGHGGERVPAAFPGEPVRWIEQTRQLGTGHAVQQALPELRGSDRVLVLYGDVPLISAKTLHALTDEGSGAALSLLSVLMPDPAGYGRIVRGEDGQIQGIVEHKDADAAQLRIREVNTGIMAVERVALERWVGALSDDNAQGELYLTDIVAMAVAEGHRVQVAQAENPDEVLGVNDRVQLAHLERRVQRAGAERLMRQGVSILDPDRFDLRGTLEVGRDVVIDINVLLEGNVRLGDEVRIGANSVIRNSRLGPRATVLENCVVDHAEIGADCVIGPFTRIRPDTRLDAQVHLGNFVEVKKSTVGQGSKINHLSYVGDTTVGKRVNIGAGTIVCNYDGAHKHRTSIGDDAFIGSDSQLVAPVEIGEGATVGAGSTITRNAPPSQLTLSRAPQVSVKGWRRPTKKPSPQGG